MTKLWSHQTAQAGPSPPEPLSQSQMETWLRAMGRQPEAIPQSEWPEAVSRCRDEQEALSRRWGEGAVVVLPLLSGNFALFGANRQLVDVVPAGRVAETCLGISQTKLAEAQARAKPQMAQSSSKSIEDLM